MKRVPLDRVRYLSLREIAQQFAPEAGIPESAVLRELQYAVINIPRLRAGQDLFEVPPPIEALADPDRHIVDYDWLIEFCGKQGWKSPTFWKGQVTGAGERYPGRPSIRPAILEEFARRVERNEVEDTLAEQARVLSKWAKTKFRGEQTPTPKTVQNQLRGDWRRAKESH